MPEKRISRIVKPERINQVVRSLNTVDIDVRKLEERITQGRDLDTVSWCIIDISCCIIDCTKCSVENPGDIVINPGDMGTLKGFVFKVPEQAANPHAPLYYFPEVDLRDAFRIGHQSLKAPSQSLKTRHLGLAGEMFSTRILAERKIAPTAPVIAIIPKKTRAPKQGT